MQEIELGLIAIYDSGLEFNLLTDMQQSSLDFYVARENRLWFMNISYNVILTLRLMEGP